MRLVHLYSTSFGHVLAFLGCDLLATAFDDMFALFRLHILEAVDQGDLLLLGCRCVSKQSIL
jgi:hypothetical protein